MDLAVRAVLRQQLHLHDALHRGEEPHLAVRYLVQRQHGRHGRTLQVHCTVLYCTVLYLLYCTVLYMVDHRCSVCLAVFLLSEVAATVTKHHSIFGTAEIGEQLQ